MKSRFFALLICGCLLVSAPLLAHHSFAAEYDKNKQVKVTGTVTKFDFSNPHSWIYVDVKDNDGKVTNWHFELGPPNALFRLGWKKDAIPVGLEVDISGYRAKSGEPVGNARSLTLPNGKELFAGGSTPEVN